jgi:hypothetical protein
MTVRHVVDIDNGAVHGFHRQVVQRIDERWCGVGLHLVFKAVELDGPRRSNHVLRGNGIHHVDRRKAARLQGVQVQVYLNLALFSAEREGRLRALDGRHLNPDSVGGDVVQLLLVQALPGDSQLQHGHARRVVLDDERRKCAGRQRTDLHRADG